MDSALFIGTIIIAVTQLCKYLSPRINGIVTMVTAVIVGIVTALLSTQIGLAHITVAQGILIALSAIGVHTVASNVNSGTSTPKV